MNNFGGGVFGAAAKQVGGLAKHALGKMVAEPMEVLKNTVGAGQKQQAQENQAMEAMEQGAQASPTSQNQPAGDSAKPNGFKTVQDFQRYQQLSTNKDQLEINMLRKKLAQEWGVEQGMAVARKEYEQKEEQRKQVEEQEEEQKKVFEFEQKKAEDQQVAMAKNASSAEKRMAVAG